ncbi:BTAD domain-containing putative transcriptional regulator [Streptomyces sp. NPDC005574]|uniref:AfsR/SARP family transcriptional regulator n=1 Tax=Streptomyces sp. NPDC005574 TaxID=3156891 RepID=UPI0033AFF264
MSGDVRFAVLGSLEVTVGDIWLKLGGPVPQRILTTLLLEPGRMVPVSRLVQAAWDDHPPRTAEHQVRKAVADLRQRIPDGNSLLSTDGPGYRLDVDPGNLDLSEFSARLRQAREAQESGRVDEAAQHLRTALALWRGPVMSGSGGPVIAAASAVLEERRLAAIEQLVELRLAQGEAGELVGDLRELITEHPLWETLRGHLMVALYRSGRQAEALKEFSQVRDLLAEELGIDPSPHLMRLYEAILRDSPELAAPAPPATRAREEDVPPAQPPARAAHPVAAPCTLPYDLMDFTGRERELGHLLALAEPPGDGAVRIVAIDGMGGSGKTSLAVRAAHRLADRYPDGQLYVDLRGFTPGEEPRRPATVIGTLLRTLGVPSEHVPDDSDGRVQLWRATVARRRLLLVLDNALDAAQIRPLIPASAGCLVVTASRNHLAGLDGADRLSLSTMSPSDSLELIRTALGEQRAAAEPQAVAELSTLCGRLPLALRVATARLRSRPHWSVRYLVDRLGDEARRLDELASGEHSVEATLQLSYQALDGELRDALRLLGLHPGAETDAHSAAALLGVGVREAEDALEHLLDMNLVEQYETGRYAFHDLVRSFTRRLLGRNPREERVAFGRLLEYCLAVTETACRTLYPGRAGTAARFADAAPFQQPALTDATQAEALFEREHVMLLAAVERAEQEGFDHHAVQLARNLIFHLNSRSHLREYRRAAGVAVRAARRLAQPHTLGLSLTNLSAVLWKLGRFREGVTAATEALDIAQRLGDRGGEAMCLDQLGLLHSCLGDLGEARRYLERAITLHADLPDHRQRSYAWCNLSTVLTWQGHPEEAAAAAQRATLLCQDSQARGEEIIALTDLAAAHLAMQQPAAALVPLRQALELGDESRMPEDLALTLALAADASERLGAGQEATHYAAESLRIIQSKGCATRNATVENTLGAYHCRRGDYPMALALHTSAHTHATAIEYRIEIARALNGIAEALEGTGEFRQSGIHRHQAYEHFTAMGVLPNPSLTL